MEDQEITGEAGQGHCRWGPALSAPEPGDTGGDGRTRKGEDGWEGASLQNLGHSPGGGQAHEALSGAAGRGVAVGFQPGLWMVEGVAGWSPGCPPSSSVSTPAWEQAAAAGLERTLHGFLNVGRTSGWVIGPRIRGPCWSVALSLPAGAARLGSLRQHPPAPHPPAGLGAERDPSPEEVRGPAGAHAGRECRREAAARDAPGCGLPSAGSSSAGP